MTAFGHFILSSLFAAREGEPSGSPNTRLFSRCLSVNLTTSPSKRWELKCGLFVLSVKRNQLRLKKRSFILPSPLNASFGMMQYQNVLSVTWDCTKLLFMPFRSHASKLTCSVLCNRRPLRLKSNSKGTYYVKLCVYIFTLLKSKKKICPCISGYGFQIGFLSTFFGT